MTRVLFLGLILMLSTVDAWAQFGNILRELGLKKDDRPNQEETSLGLKEALKIGAKNAVGQVGQVDGYLKDEVIKILLPDKLQKVARVLRFAGMGDQLDELEVGMNRAAEKAAPLAKDIFWDAIKEMTFADAHRILTGGETSATDYFRDTTGERLFEIFHPVVEEKMDEVGVKRQYDQLTVRMKSMPFVSSQNLDLDDYVVDKALDGLFHVLGEEEKKIRNNPAARVTDLLRKVFGR